MDWACTLYHANDYITFILGYSEVVNYIIQMVPFFKKTIHSNEFERCHSCAHTTSCYMRRIELVGACRPQSADRFDFGPQHFKINNRWETIP